MKLVRYIIFLGCLTAFTILQCTQDNAGAFHMYSDAMGRLVTMTARLRASSPPPPPLTSSARPLLAQGSFTSINTQFDQVYAFMDG